MNQLERGLGYFVFMVFIFIVAVLAIGCGTTKKFYRDCEQVDNGWVCEEI